MEPAESAGSGVDFQAQETFGSLCLSDVDPRQTVAEHGPWRGEAPAGVRRSGRARWIPRRNRPSVASLLPPSSGLHGENHLCLSDIPSEPTGDLAQVVTSRRTAGNPAERAAEWWICAAASAPWSLGHGGQRVRAARSIPRGAPVPKECSSALLTPPRVRSGGGGRRPFADRHDLPPLSRSGVVHCSNANLRGRGLSTGEWASSNIRRIGRRRPAG